MICRRCGKDNEAANQYCGRCGLDLTVVGGDSTSEDAEQRPCYRHSKELTRLSCGKCERPICTKCARIGPAGVRCPDCARLKTHVSARGVAHDMFASFRGIFRTSPFVLYILVMLIFSVGGFGIRSCGRSQERPPIRYEQSDPELGQER